MIFWDNSPAPNTNPVKISRIIIDIHNFSGFKSPVYIKPFFDNLNFYPFHNFDTENTCHILVKYEKQQEEEYKQNKQEEEWEEQGKRERYERGEEI